MVITILEALVTPKKWTTLEQAYKAGTVSLPPMIVQTFLAQNSADPTMWRIITHWRSHEALDAYRQSVETPEGVLMFRAAGAEPTLSVFDVSHHVSAEA